MLDISGLAELSKGECEFITGSLGVEEVLLRSLTLFCESLRMVTRGAFNLRSLKIKDPIG
jgi:hypothetical protein